jgi:hypothetical protein
MKLHVVPAAVVFTLTFLPAEAQSPRDSDVARLDSAALGVSADELETFADIFVAIEQTTFEYQMELATVASEQEARSLEARIERATQEKIEQRGWTKEKYEAVSDTVNANPQLLDRALALIEERS